MLLPENILAIVIGFMVLANRLVAALITPILEKLKVDKFWLTYIAWGVSGILVWLTGANLFAQFIPNPLVGQILTAIVSGGGANLLYDLTQKPKPIELSGELLSTVENPPTESE